MCVEPSDLNPALIDLAAAVGPGDLVTDPAIRESFERDWTGRFGGSALCVVRPRDAEQVAHVLAVCRSRDLAVVPQGGNTGLVGGGVPRPDVRPADTVIVSLAGLDQVGEVDPVTGQVEVGAGVTLATLQAVAESVGMEAGLDLGARDTATIGGLVACDAGGVRALRYGTARNMVAGLEAVLGDGRHISRMSGLAKDNAGYRVPDLLVGSEGTLGLITAVRWQLVPRLPARAVALIGLDRIEDAIALLARLRARLGSLESCDFVLGPAFEMAREHLGRDPYFPGATPGVYLVVECADRRSPLGALAEQLDEAGVERALLADDVAGRKGLWSCRECLSEILASEDPPLKMDLGVPVGELPRFLGGIEEGVAKITPTARCVLFGHLGDGNVHFNVMNAGESEHEIASMAIRLVLNHGGTISAEHGIGVAKAEWTERALGADEVAVMRTLKDALDPSGIMNPGVVLPATHS